MLDQCRVDAAGARCSTCDKPLFGEVPDATGRCLTCSTFNARPVECCGFLYEGESCTCATEGPRCVDCFAPIAAGELCERCIDRRHPRHCGLSADEIAAAGELQPPLRLEYSHEDTEEDLSVYRAVAS